MLFRSVLGLAPAATSGSNYAIFGVSQGSSGNDWAGYFYGRGYFSGMVGIGTTTPIVMADVAGQVRTNYDNNINGGNYADAGVRIESPSTITYPFLSLYNSTAASGTCLISQSVPGIVVADNTNFAYAPITASAFITGSDISLKKEINSVTKNEYNLYLEQIRSIESITYLYKNENIGSQKTINNGINRVAPHIGFTAQSLPNTTTSQISETPGKINSDKKIGYNLSDMAGLT